MYINIIMVGGIIGMSLIYDYVTFEINKIKQGLQGYMTHMSRTIAGDKRL